MGDVSTSSTTSSQPWREEGGRGGEFFVNNKEKILLVQGLIGDTTLILTRRVGKKNLEIFIIIRNI